jgi:hypothetical protein
MSKILNDLKFRILILSKATILAIELSFYGY